MFYVSDLLDLVVPAELQLPEVNAGGLLHVVVLRLLAPLGGELGGVGQVLALAGLLVLLLGLGHGLGHQTLHAVVNVGDRLVHRIGLGGLLRLRLLGRDLVQLVQIGLGLLVQST